MGLKLWRKSPKDDGLSEESGDESEWQAQQQPVRATQFVALVHDSCCGTQIDDAKNGAVVERHPYWRLTVWTRSRRPAELLPSKAMLAEWTR